MKCTAACFINNVYSTVLYMLGSVLGLWYWHTYVGVLC